MEGTVVDLYPIFLSPAGLDFIPDEPPAPFAVGAGNLAMFEPMEAWLSKLLELKLMA